MAKVTTANYDSANSQNTKEPILVLEFEGLPFVFGSNTIYTKIRYDDPDVFYDGTYVYDGLRPLSPDKQKKLIDRRGSSATISQKLEQWDGKSSIETLNIKLVDKDKIITKLCTPGGYLEDVMNRKVRVFFGYKTISYPEDYLRIFTGYVNNYVIGQGWVQFNFTDPSSRKKQQLFNASTSKLTTTINNSITTIVMSSTDNLYQTILNAKGNADAGVTIGIKIDDEIITYTNANITNSTTLTGVTRGAYGTVAAPHDAGAEISCFIALNDTPIEIALKTMLSGWNGPFQENVALRSIINDDNGGTIADSITFAQGVDLIRDYGLIEGDFITISGSGFAGNNAVWTIESFENENRTVVVVEKGLLTQENPPITGYLTAVAAFRSKYDVYPIEAGLSLTPDDVLVSAHEYIRNTFIQYTINIPVISAEKSGKTWIETYLFKPGGMYSLTQGSRISMGLTRPPLIQDLSKFINEKNVVSAKDIEVKRGLSERFFYNEIWFKYNYDPIRDDYINEYRVIDADAQSRMRQVSVLEIEFRGLNDSPNSEVILKQRAARLLQRYKFAAETIELRTFFSVGHSIDAGDIVVLTDSDTPTLQIANTEDSTRGVYNRIMEVQERSIDISSGQANIRLLSNNGFAFSDRYGVISGSSLVDGTYANTTSQIRIKASFGAKFGTQEWRKWVDYQGSRIAFHDNGWNTFEETTYTLDATDPNIMHLSPPLSAPPVGDTIVEFANYDVTSAAVDANVKSTFTFLDSSATIFSGSSSTVFTLDPGFSSRYASGQIGYVVSPDGSRLSPDLKILTVIGDVVTMGPIFTGGTGTLGFTPQPGDILQLAGFSDGGAGFRLI